MSIAHSTHHSNDGHRSARPGPERVPLGCMLRVQPRTRRDHSVSPTSLSLSLASFRRLSAMSLIGSATLHPILHSRIGPDQFVSRMARLREDPRFRAVQPDAFDTDGGAADHPVAVPVRDVQEGAEGGEMGVEEDEGLELWFDWAFVDFWKNHYCESGSHFAGSGASWRC